MVYSPTGLQKSIAECYRIVENACCKRPWSTSRQYPTVCVRAVRSIKRSGQNIEPGIPQIQRTLNFSLSKQFNFFFSKFVPRTIEFVPRIIEFVPRTIKFVPRTIECNSQLGFTDGISFQLSLLIQIYSLR